MLVALGALRAVGLDLFNLFPGLLATRLSGGVGLLFSLRPAFRPFLFCGGLSRLLPLEDAIGERLDIETGRLFRTFFAVLAHQLALARRAR